MTTGTSPNDTQQGRGQAAEPVPEGATNYVTGIADGNLATPVRLRDYLAGVGVVFRLPKRNRKREAAAAAEVAERQRIRIPYKFIAKAVAPLALIAIGYLVWDRFLVSVPLPAEVVGTWTTNDGRHAGRNFWLNQQSVAFQNGPKADQFAVYSVKRVTSRTAADTVFLNIEYEQSGTSALLAVAFRASPAPELRLVNQPSVKWTRSGGAPVIQ